MSRRHAFRVPVPGYAALMLLSLVCCRTVDAQPVAARQPATGPRWHAYIGGTPFLLFTDSAPNRVLNGENSATGGVVLEGGVRVVRNIAVGIEVFPRSSVSTDAGGAHGVDYTMVQNERVIAFVGRATVFEERRAAIDAVIGPSITWADGTMSASCCFDTSDASARRRSVDLLAGADFPIRPISHFALVPRIRVLAGEHLYYDGHLHESRTGIQVMAGFGARVLF